VLIAVAPGCAYAWTSATGDARITDDTWGLDHWPAQAALPLAVPLICALAAGHPPGWRLPAWSAGAAAAWFATSWGSGGGAMAAATPTLGGVGDVTTGVAPG
jgi:hypothetical protein